MSSSKEVITLKNGVNIYNSDAMAKLKEAAAVASEIRSILVGLADEGNTTYEIEKEAEHLLIKHNCQSLFKGYEGYPFITCQSTNDVIVHGFPNKQKLKLGDVLSLDIGVRHSNGYCGDTARTVIVGGSENSSSRELVELGKQSFQCGLEKAYPGNTASDIGHAIFKEIVKKRVDGDFRKPSVYKVFDRFRGHGIGLELHEDPSIPNWGNPGCGDLLLEGMCICIEPVIVHNSSKILRTFVSGVPQYSTHDRKPSTHYENQIFITSSGPIVLT